jgi:TOBE domain-containing protein
MRTIQALKEKSCVHSALYASISRNDQASNAHFRSFPVKNYSKDPFRGWLRVIFCRRAASTPMSVLRVRLEREAGRLSLRVGAARLRPGERLARLLDGFRDQHIGIALPANDISLGPAGDVQTIPARVQAHEWVGRELQIVVALDGSPIRLRTQQRLALRIGDEVAIRLNFERAHAFDPKTGCMLRSSTD